MKIFIIARGYPSDQEPTWGCFEKDQAEALSKKGHQVVLLSVDPRFRWFWRHLGIQCSREESIVHYNIFLLPFAFLFFFPQQLKYRFYTWQLELIYKMAVKNHGVPDILYSHYLGNSRYAIYLRNKYQIPLVGIEHWSIMAHPSIPTEIIQSAKKIYSSMDCLLTVSSSLKDNIYRQVNIDSIVVPNIVGHEFCYKQHKSNDIFKIITVGRLVQGKRFDLLIKALVHIQQPFELKIIGEGPERKNLQKLIVENKLQDKIFLIGTKTKQEIVEHLQRSDFFVLPSQSETFGVAYIEALACGLPVIATDCGGPRDIVTESNGLLIPNEDIDALGKAILHMVKNINEYDRIAIARDCQNRFSSEVIAKQLTDIFEETIKRHKEQE